ncbi:hypothetical protein [Burkholderia ubonensis]|uniref:hypothetical protein n=1 Tax=Burkholderia ubonensis TaxID=101571 RepID=UPI000ACA42C9|nr:hypothetical protein [Burkholderia ubonensis]
MSKTKNKGQAGAKKNSGGSKGSAGNSNSVNKGQEWSELVCSAADGKGTLLGLQQLGPASNPQNLLITATLSNNPQCLLAAEQIIHLVDGWRYAAAATSAFLAHSNAAATHFAYYAEMRAAISLFAWSGIRAKWHGYFYLDKDGNKKLTNKNPQTHTGVWELWNEWIKRPDVEALLSNSIHLHPIATLRHVVRAINFTIPKKALQQWGADLVKITDDHTARNTASYEAIWASAELTRMETKEAELVRDLWKLFLPDGGALGFDAALCNHFVSMLAPADPAEKSEFISKVAKHISDNCGAPKDEIMRRLTPDAYISKPFEYASAEKTEAENVLCRAFLLLRIAMLALKRSLSAPGVSPVARKWLESWLEHAGLWSRSFEIDPIDIEVDYRDAVTDFSFQPPLPNSIWDGENSSRLAKLSRPDACIAWSLVA